MAKTYTIEIGDDIESDFLASEAVAMCSGADGLFSKVVLDAVRQVRRDSASPSEVVEPVESSVSVSEVV